MEVVDIYFDIIIKKIEKHRDDLLKKINSKSIFNILCRHKYRKHLDKIDSLLLKYYRKVESIMQEEFEVQKKYNEVYCDVNKNKL